MVSLGWSRTRGTSLLQLSGTRRGTLQDVAPRVADKALTRWRAYSPKVSALNRVFG